jgi:hypothetical protein
MMTYTDQQNLTLVAALAEEQILVKQLRSTLAQTIIEKDEQTLLYENLSVRMGNVVEAFRRFAQIMQSPAHETNGPEFVEAWSDLHGAIHGRDYERDYD